MIVLKPVASNHLELSWQSQAIEFKLDKPKEKLSKLMKQLDW